MRVSRPRLELAVLDSTTMANTETNYLRALSDDIAEEERKWCAEGWFKSGPVFQETVNGIPYMVQKMSKFKK